MTRSRLRRYFRHGLVPQLIAFEACMRLGGITRAADELALAQPTVSGLMRRLSETVGAPLVKARGGRIELTDAGREVALLCEEVLGALGRFDERTSLMLARLKPFGSIAATTTHGVPPGNGLSPRSHAAAAQGVGAAGRAGE